MAANFETVTPTWVYPNEPEYHNVISQTEGMKKIYFNVSGTSVSTFKLVFNGITDAQHTTLKNHYNSTLGGYDYFLWCTVPSYIDSGNSKIGRWVTGTFKEKPQAKSWDCEIEFETDNG